MRMQFPKQIAMIGLVLGLSGCAAVEAMVSGYDPAPNLSCEERTVRQLQGVDFATAPLVDVVIRRGEFSPMIVRLTKGRAYVLRLRNRDDEVHVFNAPEFFDSIAVSAVAMDNDILETVCPGPAVEVQPGQSFEMQFFAASDGVYEYRDTGSHGISVGNVFNAAPPGGIIRIEESY